ncbi:hypothetical protein LCGC14_1240170 [marine sediment metagenome]|uniref:Uncharacterized protein n=1 Tax=marine sediment metagenome TaxID=412755 RepID=A0A0F9LTA8_9ZZZZ
MTQPDIPAGKDAIDEQVKVIVLEQVAHFQQIYSDPVEAMNTLLGSIYRGPLDELLWADVAGLVEDIYREDQGLPAKRVHKYSKPRYKKGYPI